MIIYIVIAIMGVDNTAKRICRVRREEKGREEKKTDGEKSGTL